MIKNDRQGFGKRRSAEAEALRKAEENKRITQMAGAGIGVVVLLIIIGIAWFMWPVAEEPVTEAGADTGTSQVMPSDRPLAALDPAERNGYFTSAPEMMIDTSKSYSAVVTTEKGKMEFTLFDDVAPLTVNNFVFLANQGFYDGVTFHRVLQDFMAQTGDPTGTGMGGPGYQFADEFDPTLTFDKPGLLAMANSGPGTNGSQFFITHVPTPHLNQKHTIFGEITSGQDVLNSIRLREPSTDTQPGDKIVTIEIIEK